MKKNGKSISRNYKNYIIKLLLCLLRNILVSSCCIGKFFKLSYIHIFLYLALFVFSSINLAKADDGYTPENPVIKTIIDTLSSLTCETQGVGNLLRSEFSHTCIPAPFFTFAISNIVSPGLYANMVLRLYINDQELFPESCTRGNRIDYSDQKISFSLCNNIKLATARVGAIADVAVAIAAAMFTGKDPWDDIVAAWKIPKSEYHNIYKDKKEGDTGNMFDIGIIPWIPWNIVREKDKFCVATRAFSGWIPVGCKYIKEPFPISIYADFLDVSPEGIKNLDKITNLTSCAGTGSCYKRAHDNSKAPIVITGPIIECVRTMVAKLMVSSAVCSFDDFAIVKGNNLRETSTLYHFQEGMHKIVSLLLIIYIIFFGYKVILAGSPPDKATLINFVVKFIFVTYFSIGMNINGDSGSDLDRMDGMIQFAFPLLLNGMNELASWMMNASPSGLCNFNDVAYPEKLEYLRLWDALDCRISHYLGLDAMQTMMVENATRNHNFAKLDFLSFPIPPYIYLLVPAFLSGNPTLISLVVMYPLMIISVGAFIVNATVVCMISIVILGVLAPLFVPMYLFNYTKGYFESWLKLLISFMIQPMVAVTFMTTMLAVFDYGFYGTCKYTHKDFKYTGQSFKIENVGLSSLTTPPLDGRAVRYFYVDQNWDDYSTKEATGCQESLGFILNNPFQFLFSVGKDALTDKSMPWLDDTSGKEDKSRFSFLSAVKSSGGLFFSSVEVIFDKIKKLAISLLVACLVLYLMYNLSESVSEFAADMTEGVDLSSVSIGAQTIAKAGMKAISAAGGAAGQQGAGDQASAGRSSGAEDKLSGGGSEGGAEDKLSGGEKGSNESKDVLSGIRKVGESVVKGSLDGAQNQDENSSVAKSVKESVTKSNQQKKEGEEDSTKDQKDEGESSKDDEEDSG